MKERLAIAFVVVVFMINVISASYRCEDNTTLLEDIGKLKIGGTDNINGINIGLSFSQEIGKTGVMEAEIFIDSKSVTLVDGSETAVKFSDDSNYSVSLLNSSDNTATIKVDGDTKSLNILDTIVVGGIQTSLSSSVGDYPGTPIVKLVFGKSKLSLSSKDNPDEIIDFRDQKHLIELDSATDDEAFVIVEKCANKSLDIIQVADSIVPSNSTINQTNSTNGTSTNNTSVNNTNTNHTVQNATNNQSNNNSGNVTNEGGTDNKYNSLIKTSSIIIIAIAVIVFLMLLSKYLKNRSYQNQSAMTHED